MTPGLSIDVLALDEALQRLARLDPRHAQVVELRYFGGLSVEDTAAAHGPVAGDGQTRLDDGPRVAVSRTGRRRRSRRRDRTP